MGRFATCPLLALLLLFGPARGFQADERGTALFDGKTLKGWKAHPDSPGMWRVERGLLLGSGAASHLFSAKEYGDFRLTVEAMINDKGASTIYFRARYGPGFPKGYEAIINCNHPYPAVTGSLFGIADVTKTKAKPGEWCTLVITARGNRITLEVDGEKTADVTLDPKKHPIHARGHVVVQQHDPRSVIAIRKVRIEELE